VYPDLLRFEVIKLGGVNLNIYISSGEISPHIGDDPGSPNLSFYLFMDKKID
jgi:hypothetical protein